MLQSPNYPQMYPTGLNCKWYIKVPDGYSQINLYIWFDLDQKFSSYKVHRCRRDHLSITQHMDGAREKRQKYCHKTGLIRTHAFGRKVEVLFWTTPFRRDVDKATAGFRLLWFASKGKCETLDFSLWKEVGYCSV